uniref:Uncharacterized protein isoform X2 n=1 Tax=Pogona vitticeps TaxID=103695 RepID=A0ABM5FBK0_9SAUR
MQEEIQVQVFVLFEKVRGAAVSPKETKASMEPKKKKKKRRRRRRFQSGKPMEVSSKEFLGNARKKPADIEQLAQKYMVLSSSVLSEGFQEKASYAELQVLDPYDADYEELSGESDCSLGSLDSSHSTAILPKHPIIEPLTTGDSLNPEDLDSSSTSLFRAVSVTIAQEEEEPGLHKTAKILPLTAESSWYLRPYAPSRHSGISENAVSDPALQPMLMECDNELCEKPSITRKQGRSILDCTGEKIRKRLRVA